MYYNTQCGFVINDIFTAIEYKQYLLHKNKNWALLH